MNVNEEYCMPTRTIGKRRRGPAERDWADVRAGRPIPVHHVVARYSDKGLEVLRMPLGGRGETLPVFSAGWAARGYLFAEAPGVGWYVKTCTPGELFSLLAGPCARVEWVALDPRPGPRVGGEAANVMPRENFVDYLSCSRAPLWLRGYEPETTGGDPHGRENDR
jgi:hypothetical protein